MKTAASPRAGAPLPRPAPEQVEDAVGFLAGHWPGAGRHNAYRALCGGLLREVCPEAARDAVVRLVEATGDGEGANREALLGSTAEALAEGRAAEGWPRLRLRLGPDGPRVVREFRRRLGLTIDLAALADHKKMPVEFLRSLGLHDLDDDGVGIPYRDAGGKVVGVKKRTRLRAGDGSYWPKGLPLMAYGEDRLHEAVRAGYLAIVEGESDPWTMWYHGLPALGLPGAGTVATTLQRGHVAGVPLAFAWREPDASGAEFVEGVRRRLGGLGWAGVLKEISAQGVKDPSDLHARCGGDKGRFAEAWAAAVGQARQLDLGPPRADAPKAVRILAPYQPFPVDVLPAPLVAYVREGAAALGCDAAFVALPVLSAVASLIGNTRVVRLKRGWEELAIIWVAIVGDSGTLKSPAYLLAVAYLFRLQKRLLRDHKARCATYQQEVQEYREKARDAKKNGEDPGPPPEPPVLERVVCSDTTIEKLAEILEDNPRGTLLARDELAGWLGSFTRYKGKQGGTDLPNWLELHRAGTLVVDRKTGDRRTIFVPRAAVSVVGGIQPGTLARALTPEFLDAGLAARLLMAMPPKLPKCWREDEVAEGTVGAYQKLLDGLRSKLDFNVEAGDDGEEKVPHVLKLSRDAKREWVKFYDGWAQEQAAAEGEMAAALGKLEGYAARFSLLHHVVTHVAAGKDDLCPVGPESVRSGVRLCHWFANEARRIYSILSESTEERETRRLAEFIHARGGQVTARALQKSNSRKYPTADAAEAALDALARDGLGAWSPSPTTERGGRPTRTFVLRPTPDTTDTTPAEVGAGAPTASDETPDTTSDTTPPDVAFPEEIGGCVGCVGCRTQSVAPASGGAGPVPGETVSSDGMGLCRSRRPRGLGRPAGSPARPWCWCGTRPAWRRSRRPSRAAAASASTWRRPAWAPAPTGCGCSASTWRRLTAEVSPTWWTASPSTPDPCSRRWRARPSSAPTCSSTCPSSCASASSRAPPTTRCCSRSSSTAPAGRRVSTGWHRGPGGSWGRNSPRSCRVRTGRGRCPASSWSTPPATCSCCCRCSAP